MKVKKIEVFQFQLFAEPVQSSMHCLSTYYSTFLIYSRNRWK